MSTTFDDLSELTPAADENISVISAGGGPIIIGDRFIVTLESPVSELDMPGARAYSCQDTADSNHSVLAYVCDSLVPPRSEILNPLRRLERANMVCPQDWAVADFPGKTQRQFIIIADRPGGRRVMSPSDDQIPPFTEDRLSRSVLIPIIKTLRPLNEIAITHRNIRADNLFYRDAAQGTVLLGECFTSPPAMYQPALYEPIDSAMAEPAGRGSGTIADDLYSLGVTMAILLRGNNPAARMSDSDIIKAKLREGSYATLIGDTKVTLGMMEVLRGLLTDDPLERWSIGELELWLNGRRLSPKQAKLPQRAARPFRFNNQEIYTAPMLSLSLGLNWTEASRAVGTDPIDVWIRRSLDDEKMSLNYVTAIRSAAAYGGRRGIEDRTVSRAMIALDPSAPIKYRKFCARVDGFATALMVRAIQSGETQDVAEAITAKLPQFWFENQIKQRPEDQIFRRQFEMMAFMLGRQSIGYGLERCIYELNSGASCLSPLINDYYVISLSQLLPALDIAAQKKKNLKGDPIDRHIAAFIAARLKHPLDNHLQAMANTVSLGTKRMGMIRLLSEVQQYTGEQTPRHVAKWLVDLAKPIIDTYHSRPFQEKLTKEVQRLCEKGSLMDIAYSLENASRREKDNEGFRSAMREYSDAETEINRIEAEEMTKPEAIEKKGQELAAYSSGILASVAFIFILFMHLNGA